MSTRGHVVACIVSYRSACARQPSVGGLGPEPETAATETCFSLGTSTIGRSTRDAQSADRKEARLPCFGSSAGISSGPARGFDRSP